MQIPNAAIVTLYWAIAGSVGVNVLGASHSGSVVFDQTLAEALGASIKAAFTTHLSPHMPAVSALARVGVRSLSSPNLATWRDTGGLVSGVAVGDALPSQTAQCITLRTARSGKSYRGRTYLGGWGESVSDLNGHQLAAAGAAGVSFMTAVQAALTARNLTLAVLSRPAYEQIVERTTIVPGSDNVVDRISHSTPKAGSFQNVTAVESRTAVWETMRTRANSRGDVLALLNTVAGNTF